MPGKNVDENDGPLGSNWVVELINLVQNRQMMAASNIVKDHKDILAQGDFGSYNPHLIDICARLLDRDPTLLALVEGWITKYCATVNIGKLNVLDTIHIELATAIVHFQKGEYEQTIHSLQYLRWLSDRCKYDDLRVMVRYYLARAMYRTGLFKEARAEILEAENMGPLNGAYFDILMVKTWILFREEDIDDAQAALREAEKLLKTRDYLDVANVKTLWGRFSRQEGNFDEAIRYAREAGGIFQENNADAHPLLARAQVHQAFAMLLKIRDDGRDEDFDRHCKDALDLLRDAEKICGNCHIQVLDRVHYFRAAWYFYLDKYKLAKSEAVLAYEMAEKSSDRVIMAHVRILQCQIARAEGAGSADEALRLALEAWEHALKTDNRRIRIRALIWKAVTEADPPRRNIPKALEHLNAAGKHLRKTDKDYLRWELNDAQTLLKHLENIKNVVVLPVITVSEVLADKDLDRTLNKVAVQICEAVYERAGKKIRPAADLLGIGRNRFKKICPHLKDTHQTSGPSNQ